MYKHLILRFDAPLMSFGAPIVDNYGRTERFMALSALAGLLANALGYDHRQSEKTQRLQSRLRYAQRCDRPGSPLRDFQTVSLGQEFLKSDQAWTTWGVLDERKGGSAREGTHIRYRDYVADAIYTLALCLQPEDEVPNIEDCAEALINPARPLFIGRKPCLPAAPLLYGSTEADSPLEALLAIPRLDEARSGLSEQDGLSAWWSADDEGANPSPWREIRAADQRDWRNQIHGGERIVRHGLITLNGELCGEPEVPRE
jgi:CRISPR system Cascade subunit CasD